MHDEVPAARAQEAVLSHVYVVGSLNWDASLTVQRLPGPGETVLGSWGAQGPGGKGSNQVVAACRAGATTTMVGAVGDDAHGGSTYLGIRQPVVPSS